MKLRLILFWWKKKQSILEKCQRDSLGSATQVSGLMLSKKNLFKRIKMKRNIQLRIWKLKEKETRKKFKDKIKNLVNTEAKICGVYLRMGLRRVMKDFLERKTKEETRKHMVVE